jgi:hypothetical protein
VAILVEADESSREELINNISLKLHEASVKDLLIPARSSETTTYDIDLVQDLLNRYMTNEKKKCDIESMLGNRSILNVGKLVDGYLGEIAHDPNLGLSSFVDLSQSVPDFARPNHDGLYRAIDIYLKVNVVTSKTMISLLWFLLYFNCTNKYFYA